MPQNPSVKEIVKDYMEKNGFDGLFCDDCGCPVDDLFLCSYNLEVIDCQAGHKLQDRGEKPYMHMIGGGK